MRKYDCHYFNFLAKYNGAIHHREKMTCPANFNNNLDGNLKSN